MPIITLTTDFGEQDGYVAAMRGVILGLTPHATLVDVSHAVAPGAIRQGAYVLATAAPYFPADTVHVAVVDPGVGSARRPLLLRTPAGLFVGPDNGLLTETARLAWGEAARGEAYHLNRPATWRPLVSATFHGRDIFAPVAARLALGASPSALGDPIPDPVTLPPLDPTPVQGGWRGEVLHVDRFGNLITTLEVARLPAPLLLGHTVVAVAGRRVALAQTFSDVEVGGLVAYVGSSGRIEIAVRQGDAAATLGVGVGTPITVWTP
ncbi:MAG: SAM-dependent chlorinase/fluorinase [Anaerolineae bacterium]|nr:SAM-dependent chlorinase/fluorinase [Anaerolineae bacterium]